MPCGCEFEGLPCELGGAGRVGCAECVGGLEKRDDSDLVPWLRALRELLSDLDGKGAAAQEDVSRLAIEGPADRRGGTCPYSLADQVVAKGETVVTVDKDVGLNKLFNGL